MELNDAYRELEAKARIAREKRADFESLLHAAIRQKHPRVQIRLADSLKLDYDRLDGELIKRMAMN